MHINANANANAHACMDGWADAYIGRSVGNGFEDTTQEHFLAMSIGNLSLSALQKA